MKHVVTDLNDTNEPVMFNNSILGNYSYDTFFGNYTYETSSFTESNTQSEILHCTQIVESNSNIVYQTNITSSVQSNIIPEDILEVFINSTNPTNPKKIENSKSTIQPKKEDPNMWMLFFDGSKSLEGAGVGFILKDTKETKKLIACIQEFPCTNNTAEYESLLQGLTKAVYLKAEKIKVFGDSKIIIK